MVKCNNSHLPLRVRIYQQINNNKTLIASVKYSLGVCNESYFALQRYLYAEFEKLCRLILQIYTNSSGHGYGQESTVKRHSLVNRRLYH